MYKVEDHAEGKYNKASKLGNYSQYHLQYSSQRPVARLALRCKPIVILLETHQQAKKPFCFLEFELSWIVIDLKWQLMGATYSKTVRGFIT